MAKEVVKEEEVRREVVVVGVVVTICSKGERVDVVHVVVGTFVGDRGGGT
jgi:hypothetical protein